MMLRLLEGSTEAVARSQFNIKARDDFFALRRVVFGDGPVGLRIDLVEEVNERSMGIFLGIEGGLDTERGIDGDGWFVGVGGVADGVGDETTLVLVWRNEIRLADVGGDIDTSAFVGIVKNYEWPFFGNGKAAAKFGCAGRRLDVSHPADVLEAVGAAAVVAADDRVVGNGMEIGAGNAEIDFGSLWIVGPASGEIFLAFEM